MDDHFSFYLIAAVFITLGTTSDAACVVPNHFWGDWYSFDRGDEIEILIDDQGLNSKYLDGQCLQYIVHNDTIDANGRYDATILFYDRGSNCYQCWEMYSQTPNVIQYKQSSCRSSTSSNTELTMQDVCQDILPQSDLSTLFKKTIEIVSCKQTFEGVFQFSYEVDYGGGGVCDSPRSVLVACQEPGSPYVDNQVFNMKWGKCPDVASSSNRKVRFQCMGTWRDHNDNIYSAVADLGQEVWRLRFRCLLTRTDQQRADNKRRYTMSRWASCSTLKSPYDGDIRLMLLPVVYGDQLVEPQCNLPRNFTGTWFNAGEYDTDVLINDTHVYFKTKIDQYTYRETYFTCQMNRDSRYLMTAVTVGKCEVDYVCLDFMPRHHNIIRWRIGKPYRLTYAEMANHDYMHRKFRQACTWSSFTFDRDDIAWTYNTFVLNPPAPVDCPIGGRYEFKQIGEEMEKYTTRIRGITARPRHQIGCRDQVSEFKSCDNNPSRLYIDAEYCATVDHTGRPIGEYDVSDRELSCVGYWMEDMRSYLITYDEEDAVSKFRCWVYQRLDWRDLIVSRATRATCGKTQTAYSYSADDGASLHLVLKESERLWDECPQRFKDGTDPYEPEAKIYVMGAAPCIYCSVLLTVLLSAASILTKH